MQTWNICLDDIFASLRKLTKLKLKWGRLNRYIVVDGRRFYTGVGGFDTPRQNTAGPALHRKAEQADSTLPELPTQGGVPVNFSYDPTVLGMKIRKTGDLSKKFAP